MVAVQALIVGVLVVVVVVTLLRPDAGPPLLGIDSPGGSQGTAVPGPGVYIPPDRGRGDGREPAPTSAPGGGAPGPQAEAGVLGAGGSEGTPADDQYGDTLTRLSARLN
jgi:hypothetical protein